MTLHYYGTVGDDIAGWLIQANPKVGYCGWGAVEIDVDPSGAFPVLAGDYTLTQHEMANGVYTPPMLYVGSVAYPLSIRDDAATATYRVWSVVRRAWHRGPGAGFTTTLDEGAASLPIDLASGLAQVATAYPDDPIIVIVPAAITG